MTNEADTCRWPRPPGAGAKMRRGPQKRADYVLRYGRDLPLAVVEAKAAYKLPGDGLQQAKEYAAALDLKFAYATNGHGIIETKADYMITAIAVANGCAVIYSNDDGLRKFAAEHIPVLGIEEINIPPEQGQLFV